MSSRAPRGPARCSTTESRGSSASSRTTFARLSLLAQAANPIHRSPLMRVDHPFRAAFDIVARGAPIEVQLVVTRRCNLSCGYCSEYDKHSPEVPYDVLAARIAAIHRLRAANIALLGGEPLLHSRIDDVVRRAATRAQVSVTTNGFLLDREIIDRLGDAGLANMQVSIDALRPGRARYIQKSLH